MADVEAFGTGDGGDKFASFAREEAEQYGKQIHGESILTPIFLESYMQRSSCGYCERCCLLMVKANGLLIVPYVGATTTRLFIKISKNNITSVARKMKKWVFMCILLSFHMSLLSNDMNYGSNSNLQVYPVSDSLGKNWDSRRMIEVYSGEKMFDTLSAPCNNRQAQEIFEYRINLIKTFIETGEGIYANGAIDKS